MIITVTIRNLSTGAERVSTHRTDDEHEAIARAVRTHYGRRASWWQDSGLGLRFGQVTEPAGHGQHNCITPRCRIDFT